MTALPTVIALYRPKPGQAEQLHKLVAGHVRLLREAGLATDTEVVVLCSRADGTVIEIFEWVSEEAPQQAHAHPEIGPYWESMAAVADFTTLASLAEAGLTFAHFERLAL